MQQPFRDCSCVTFPLQEGVNKCPVAQSSSWHRSCSAISMLLRFLRTKRKSQDFISGDKGKTKTSTQRVKERRSFEAALCVSMCVCVGLSCHVASTWQSEKISKVELYCDHSQSTLFATLLIKHLRLFLQSVIECVFLT